MTRAGNQMCLAVFLTVAVCAVAAAGAEEEQSDSMSAEKMKASRQFKQLDIVNIDRIELVNNRPSVMKGHIELVLIPRDPKEEQVILKADIARCIYKSEKGNVPDEIIIEGNVTVLQGTYRLTADKATWFREEGRVLCEGNPVATYEEGTTRAERIEYFFADSRIVGHNVSGTWLFETTAESEEDSAQ